MMLHVAVLGTGVMGSQHVRVLSQLPDVKVIAVCDTDKDLAKKVANQFSIPKQYTDFRQLLRNERPDAVTIALPTQFHKAAVLASIAEGCHVLVEKPIAPSVSEAHEMMRAAKKKGIILTVGHIERFNPVVQELKKRLDAHELGDVYLINTVRIGPFPKRLFGQVEGVLIDLACHDVDIIEHLTGAIKEVTAQLIVSGKQEIYAKALFKMNKAIQGSSEFSWVSPRRIRKIEVYGTAGMFSGDYQNQTLTFYENGDVKPIDPLKNYYEQILLKGYVKEGKILACPIKEEEPLKLELAHFVDCIKNNKQPAVSPEQATQALHVALQILKAGTTGMTVKIESLSH